MSKRGVITVDSQNRRRGGSWSRRQALALGGAALGTPLVGAGMAHAESGTGRFDPRDEHGQRDGLVPDGGVGGSSDVKVGPEVLLVAPTVDEIFQYPNSFAWDGVVDGQVVRKVRVGVNRFVDDANAEPTRLYLTSIDGGATWTEDDANAPDLIPRIQTRDGTILGFRFYTYIVPGSGDRQTEVQFQRSADGGQTYVSGTGILTTDDPMVVHPPADPGEPSRSEMNLHDRAFEGPDGTIYQPAYGRFADDARMRAVLLQTSDRGSTWTVKSTIAHDPDLLKPPFDVGFEGLNEPNVIQLDDGSLLAVLRTGSWRPLFACRSSDGGDTWSAPEQLTAGPDRQHIPGINPKLRLLPNGVLALMTGRDHIRLYLSADGLGNSWSSPTTVSGAGFESGNGGMEIVDTNRLVVVGDKRSNLRPPGNTTYPYSIWSRSVSVVRNPLHRLDLRTAYEQGDISVTTNLDQTHESNPAIGVSAAFDGRTDYNNSCLSSASVRRGHFTIDLGRSHRLNAVAVGLDKFKAQDVTVSVSPDGDRWSRVSRERYTSVSMRYTTFDPVDARFVKIELAAKAGPLVLSEVELYSATVSFENEPVGFVPNGFEATFPDVVSDQQSYAGRHSLRLYGTAATTSQKLSYTRSRPLLDATLDFVLMPVAIPSSAIVCSLVGYRINRPGTLEKLFHLAFRPAGSVEWWDGEAWHEAAGAGAVRFGEWNSIRLEAPSSRTAPGVLAINGSVAGDIGAATTLMFDIRGFVFGTSDSAFAGQEAFIDQITFSGRADEGP